ncbi:hypothetical protein AVEN_150177-1 [Araneus ventricosus]|uniref:Uncharacterized protein n=1 Tax=Araneus ventricosus TaxID=182803 RepID=A0A4Y2J7V2_ARAVE|nr:hypothetical protein AVEN_150177-1 [Araneus ventricosus]
MGVTIGIFYCCDPNGSPEESVISPTSFALEPKTCRKSDTLCGRSMCLAVLNGFLAVYCFDRKLFVCGQIGSPLHYVTEYILTTSWHMTKPKINLLQEWLKRIASNTLSRQKILNMIKFMHHNGHFFLPTT